MIQVYDEPIRRHVEEVARGSVEETLTGLLQAEADRWCGDFTALRTADAYSASTYGKAESNVCRAQSVIKVR